MKIYYTSKDIEELAAKGVKQLEVNRDVTLTDFAKETAEQVGIELIRTPARTKATPPVSRQNDALMGARPKGCQHGPVGTGDSAAARTQAGQRPANQNSGAVNDLVNLMGKLIDQGD